MFKEKNMDISLFGKIDPKDVEDYYSGIIKIGENEVEIDLNFESESINENLLSPVNEILPKLTSYADKAWNAISHDWDLGEESETARFYLQHHLEEFNDEEILELFGSSEVDKQSFIKSLSLTRVGLYPEDEDMFAVFDIQLSPDLTDYLMSVSISKYGQVMDISFES